MRMITLLLSSVGWALPAYDPKVPLPVRQLSHADAVELFSADRLGPPATTYDHQTRTVGPTELEARVEALVFGAAAAEWSAPDALRRYGRAMAQARSFGEPQPHHRVFVMEHSGLAEVPGTLGSFTGSADRPEAMAALVEGWVSQLHKIDSLSAAAISLTPDPTGDGFIGALVYLEGRVRTDPFPRVVEAGSLVPIPGEYSGDGALTSLYVNGSGGTVDGYEIPKSGVFRLGVQLPEEPGVYRAALNQVQENKLPDSPYFFSFYAGVDLPLAYSPPPVDGEATDELDVAEEAFFEEVNRRRAAVGVGPLEHLGAPEPMRTLLEGRPERERAQVRYYRKVFAQDPYGHVPHGLWGAGFSAGQTPEEAAWHATEHPVIRTALLGAESTSIGIGAQVADDGMQYAYVALEPPIEADAARDQAHAWFGDNWKGRGDGYLRAPKTDAMLDEVAADIASGKLSLKKAMKTVQTRLKKDGLQGPGAGSLWMMLLPPGEELDPSGFQYPRDSRYLAIGEGTGNLGDGGLVYTVLVFMAAVDLD